MKKVAFILVCTLGIFGTMMAESVYTTSSAIIYTQDGFEKISVSDLPNAVKEAVAKDFSEATVSEAFVNENKQYKLVLTMGEESKTVYANEKGEWLGNE